MCKVLHRNVLVENNCIFIVCIHWPHEMIAACRQWIAAKEKGVQCHVPTMWSNVTEYIFFLSILHIRSKSWFRKYWFRYCKEICHFTWLYTNLWVGILGLFKLKYSLDLLCVNCLDMTFVVIWRYINKDWLIDGVQISAHVKGKY